ncbi:MAG: MauE/DoxX family redox-associated membrane protein [Bacteroidota bacterium]
MWETEYITLLATLVVGITFCFSGAVKLNDPVGFSYKIEEYLHVFASQWSKYLGFFLPYSLALAVGIAALEVVLGTALLVHWHPYWTLRALFLLTLFFTGLTLYTATSSRIASCGCFGDAFELTPWQSFAKSVVLLLLLGVIFGSAPSAPTTGTSHYWIVATLIAALGLGTYTIRHLPLLPWESYHVGSRLTQLAKPRRPLRYLYVLEKDGQVIETTTYPQEPGYKVLSSRLLNPEEVPEVTNFSVWQEQEECTPTLLIGAKLLIIVQQGVTMPAPTLAQLRALVQHLPPALSPILIIPDGQGPEVATALDLPLHTATPILLRTMLRAPIGLLLLQEGVIKRKWHYRDLARAQQQLARRKALS